MPEKRTLKRAKADVRAGKSPTTAAGEFVREEIDIAIGLSKARRAGVPLKPPKSTASKRALSLHAKKAARSRAR